MADQPNAVPGPGAEHFTAADAAVLIDPEFSIPENEDDEEVEALELPRKDNEDETVPEDRTDEEQAEEASEDAETDGGESEEPEVNAPTLDPELLARLSKRDRDAVLETFAKLEEQAKGLSDSNTKLGVAEKAIEGYKPKAEAWDTYEKVLGDKAQAPRLIQDVIKSVAQFHGIAPAELLGELIPKAPVQEDPDAWQKEGYASPQEHKLAREMAELKSMFARELSARDAKLDSIEKEREDSRRQAEQQKYVDGIADKAIKTLQLATAGRFKVTKGMIGKAIAEFPQFREDPVRAVKAAFPDEYAKALSVPEKKRAPELAPRSGGQGRQMPPPSEFNARDAFELVSGT